MKILYTGKNRVSPSSGERRKLETNPGNPCKEKVAKFQGIGKFDKFIIVYDNNDINIIVNNIVVHNVDTSKN